MIWRSQAALWLDRRTNHRGVMPLKRLFQTNLSHLQAHLILDETLGAGYVMDTNQQSVTAPLNKLPVHATRSTSLKP
jgi:hypothetical protein